MKINLNQPNGFPIIYGQATENHEDAKNSSKTPIMQTSKTSETDLTHTHLTMEQWWESQETILS